MPDFKTLHAVKYMQGSRLRRDTLRSFIPPTVKSAPPYKQYPDADRYTLPTDWQLEEARILPLLQNRRSQRSFLQEGIPLQSLSFMLWASQGVTAAAGSHLFRTAPSAGALYPIETYISVQDVPGLDSGLYHLDVQYFELEHIRKEPVAEDLAIACLNQQFIAGAAITVIWTAVFRRNFSKYGNRGLRYVLLDAGHICQNLLLAAEATGCSGCPIAAFFDEEVNSILRVDGEEETAVYVATIGVKK